MQAHLTKEVNGKITPSSISVDITFLNFYLCILDTRQRLINSETEIVEMVIQKQKEASNPPTNNNTNNANNATNNTTSNQLNSTTASSSNPPPN